MHNKLILVIGQAPTSTPQEYPYSTTMLYDWLAQCGITIEQAQKMFEFEAVYNKFPGHNEDGKGHKKPTKEQMDQHWTETLEEKVQIADKVILLGKVAQEYFYSKPKTWSCNLDILELIHPSRLNYNLYLKNKKEIDKKLKEFLS
jgi:uracil-DNA glycosylase